MGGDGSPLPLPVRLYVRKSHRFTEFRSGKVLEPSVLTSLLTHSSRLWRPRAERGLFCRHQAWGGGSRRWALFLPVISEGHLWSHEASLASLGAQGLGTPGTGCGCLPESCLSGEKSHGCYALLPYLSQLTFSTTPSLSWCLFLDDLSLPALSAERQPEEKGPRGSSIFSALLSNRRGQLKELQGCKMRQEPVQPAPTLACDDESLTSRFPARQCRHVLLIPALRSVRGR